MTHDFERNVAVDELARDAARADHERQAVTALGPSRKDRWVRERRLISVQPSVFRLAGAPETWHQSLMAAALAVDGVVSHRSAAELWGLIQPAGYVEVSVPSTVNRRVRPPAIVHRIKDLRPGLAVERGASAHRSGADGHRPRARHAVVARAAAPSPRASRRRLSPSRGPSAAGRLGPAGPERHRDRASDPRRQSPRARQGGERAREALHPAGASGYDLPTAHLAARGLGSGPLRRPSRRCRTRRSKLAIEVDGFEHHSTPEAFQHDRTRQNELVALGWTVLRFTWHDVVHRPAHVAQLIRQADQLASSAA